MTTHVLEPPRWLQRGTIALSMSALLGGAFYLPGPRTAILLAAASLGALAFEAASRGDDE
ncbi:hypothetical protein [Corynebacterium heidelbergense]|uniref:Uncharacterized protein n=1 Tax=Corynebacterium heidelbergense TaxID=2055947 RepID=A0A364VDC5_9CORY|nr:hypothetical protein [Corynebacterium heidelbergense]RAV34621.1 hypothetical protein CWC39_02110 [Corynebacterium heidelbergense]WCZ36183.1 hypothetical protein CHEID_03115 [Corynebacterium heidelbergense]WCZ37638.1 hypothetical protein CHEID_10605 [Corynebacterium heidelbergense]